MLKIILAFIFLHEISVILITKFRDEKYKLDSPRKKAKKVVFKVDDFLLISYFLQINFALLLQRQKCKITF